MLFGRMYPGTLRAPQRAGVLLFWPERYGRGRVVGPSICRAYRIAQGQEA